MEISLLPRFLQVELTYACNSRCAFCYNPTHKTKINEHRLFHILSEINSYKINHVQLIGGEVTVLKNLKAYLLALDKISWKSIVTNGRLFRDDIIEHINEIYISLHGSELTHEHLTGADNSYSIITRNIEKYAKQGIDTNSDTVLTKYNYKEIFSIAKNAHRLGMKRLFVNIFQPEGIGSTRPDFSPSIFQIRSAIDQMLLARNEFGIEVNFGTSTPFCLDERLITEELAFTCGAGQWFASINPEGEFRICNHSEKSYGNITELELHKIWHSKSIDNEYRNKKNASPICDNCPMINVCLGGCRINSQGEYRVDPIVERDKDRILSLQRRNELWANFFVNH